jgi:hypothetical protein
MKVSIPLRSFFGKKLGTTLLVLTSSLSLNAMEQQQQSLHCQTDPCIKTGQYDQWTHQDPGQGQIGQGPGCTTQGQGPAGQSPHCNQIDQAEGPCFVGITNQGQQAPTKELTHQSSPCATTTCEKKETWGACTKNRQYTNIACSKKLFQNLFTAGKKKQCFKSWYVKGEQVGHKIGTTDWTENTWQDIRFENVSLKRTDISYSSFDNVWLNGTFKHVDIKNAKILNSTFSGKFHNTDFNKALLENVLFEKADFNTNPIHRASNFDGATLKNVHFVRSQLGNMTFKDAHLKNVSIECSKIECPNCFLGAYVHNGTQWVQLGYWQIQQLGNAIDKCKQGRINFSDWVKTCH